MRLPPCSLLLATFVLFSAVAHCAEVGPVQRLGLISSKFTNSNGYQSSAVYQITDSGYVRGTSKQFEGSNTTWSGQVGWFADTHSGVTTAIGLFDPEFLDAGGFSNNSFQFLTESGFMGGLQSRTAVAFVEQGTAAWLASAATGVTKRVGFTSPEFTKNDGFQSSDILRVNESGFAAGSSQRFNGGSASLGHAVWIANYESGNSVRAGFFSSFYTQTGGYQDSEIQKLTNSGYLIGTSTSYKGAAAIGVDAWVANANTATTTLIGLTGTGFTDPTTGAQKSKLTDITESGFIIGKTNQVPGGSAGAGVWIANASTGATTRVGFYTPDYTATTGEQRSTILAISEGGYAIGYSERLYGTSSTKGTTGWIAQGQTGLTTQIGLTSQEFTSTDGTQRTIPAFVNDSGMSAGTSTRYLSSSAYVEIGTGVWIATPAGMTSRVGLLTGPYTSTDNYQKSDVKQITNSGFTVGSSTRYSGDHDHLAGITLWAATSDGVTNAIGLSGPDYTSSNGSQLNTFSKITESGLVIGYAQKYTGLTESGQTPWIAIASSGATTPLGLTGNAFVGVNGINSSAAFLTESGLIAGATTRYIGNTYNGQSAWIFDLSTQSYVDLTLSVRASDGYATSTVTALEENGFAYGNYQKFDDAGLYVGYRAFAWVPGSGAFDLGEAVPGGLPAAGWVDLLSANFGNPDGALVGLGDRAVNSGDAIYLTTVAVPEPTICTYLALVGLLVYLSTIRNSKARDAST